MPARAYQVVDAFSIGDEAYVRSLAVDATRGMIWVGTSVGALGVDLASREVRHTFTRQDGLANEYVFASYVDQAGATWFGTNAGGASRYLDGEWKVFFPMHGLADYWVYAFAQQADGTLWIGTWAGANRVAPASLTFETVREELVNEWVYGIAVDDADRVWFGTEGGVSMWDGQGWREWTHADGLGAANSAGRTVSTNTGLGTRTRHDLSILAAGEETYNPSYVFSMLIDRDDNPWAGTWGGGAAQFVEGHWRNLSTADGLAGNVVYSMALDDAGAIWFGTNHGASRLSGGEFSHFDRANGLLGDDVYAIASTPTGEIWVGTKGGVAVLAAASGDDVKQTGDGSR